MAGAEAGRPRTLNFTAEVFAFIDSRSATLRMTRSRYVSLLVEHDQKNNVIAKALAEEAERAAIPA
jgi:hypothetical protein